MQKHMLRGSDLKTFIKQLQAKLELLGIRSLNRPGLISNPEPYAARFRDLEEIPGYSCRSCPYLTRSYKNLRAHLNVQHQIKGTDTRGDTLTPSYRFPITLQTFSRNPRNVSYFIAKGSLCARQSPLQTPLDQLLASYQQSQAQALAGLPEPQIQEPSRKELTSFLLYSHWHEYMSGPLGKDKLLPLLARPDPKRLGSDWDSILDRAYTLTHGLLPKLEGLVPLFSRHNLQTLRSETLHPSRKDLRQFRVVTKRSRAIYHVFLPHLMVYLLNVYHMDTEQIGHDHAPP
jgi:hypothetical protein